MIRGAAQRRAGYPHSPSRISGIHGFALRRARDDRGE
jgi:hypothetical protein